jgi:hypothetical protein
MAVLSGFQPRQSLRGYERLPESTDFRGALPNTGRQRFRKVMLIRLSTGAYASVRTGAGLASR